MGERISENTVLPSRFTVCQALGLLKRAKRMTRNDDQSHWRPAKDAPLTEAAGSVVSLWPLADPPELLMNEQPLRSGWGWGRAYRLFNRRSFVPRLKVPLNMWARVKRSRTLPLCLDLYSNPLVLVCAGSPCISDRNYRADVKLPIRIQESNSCWFPHLPSV
jgi:hypothetical protein